MPEFPAWVRVAAAAVTSTTNEPLPVLSVPPDAGRAVRMRLVVRETEDIDANPDGVVSAAESRPRLEVLEDHGVDGVGGGQDGSR